MMRLRKIFITVALITLIGVCIYAIATRKPTFDPAKTPPQADPKNWDSLTDEILAYGQIVATKRDLSDTEFDRLIEIGNREPFESPSTMALTSAIAHVETVKGPNHDKRKKVLIDLAWKFIKAKNADNGQIVCAIAIFRDLQVSNARDAVRPFLKNSSPVIVKVAEKYFEKVGSKD